MPDVLTQRWTVSQPSPLGDVQSSWELTSEGVHVRTDAPIDSATEMLRWDAIAEAATAVLDLPAGKGGPDMARWIPGQLEFLCASRTDGERGFMHPLPSSDAREAIVAGMRQRLGSRWVGERLPFQSAQKRFKISTRGDDFNAAGLVLAVLAFLIVFLVVFVFVFAILWLPAVVVFGGWLFRKGLIGLRDALHVANTPTAKVSSAAMGLVELEGRAIAERPTAAGASGVPSAWWDVNVEVWQTDSNRKSGRWQQVMARHGGRIDALVIEDATGRVPVWLRDADLLLREHVWEKGKHALPSAGVALLAGTAFSWDNNARVRVRERRMEAGGPVYVLGTLDEARNLSGDETGLAGLIRSLRTGEWRKRFTMAMPGFLRMPVTITIAYLDFLNGIGRGSERAQRLADVPPPALDPHAVVVWKGRADRPLTISDQRESEAIAQLRKRSLWFIGIGGAVLCWALYQLIDMF